MEEIDEVLGINQGIENMHVDDQVNGENNNRAALFHGVRNNQQNQIENLRADPILQPAALNAGAPNQPNNFMPIEQQMGNAGLDGLDQEHIEEQRDAGNQGDGGAGNHPINHMPNEQQRGNAGRGLNQEIIEEQRDAGNQGDVGAGNHLINHLPIEQQRGNAGRGFNQVNIEGQRIAGNQGARFPQANAANVQGNNIPGGNRIQGDNQGIRQGNRPVQGQNGQHRAGGVLQNVNVDQRAYGRVNNRNRNPRSAPYNPNAARIRTRNYNNLSQLLMSMAKQGAYVPANYEQNENEEEPQQF